MLFFLWLASFSPVFMNQTNGVSPSILQIVLTRLSTKPVDLVVLEIEVMIGIILRVREDRISWAVLWGSELVKLEGRGI
jgi:hypothetical protein